MIVEVLNVNDTLKRVTVKVSPYLDLSNYYTKQQILDLIELEMLEARTPIPVTEAGNLEIDWQNAIVPGDNRTYAQRFYNIFNGVSGIWNNDGVFEPQNPSFEIVFNGSLIQTVTIFNLQIGSILIL